MMHFSYIKPSVLLAPYIKYYWVLESEKSDGAVCERVIPTGFIEWMFHYKNTFVIKGSKDQIQQPRSLVSGINSNYSDVTTCGESGVITVTFYPHGAAHFMKFPLSDIENTSIDLCDIYKSKVKDVEQQICHSNSLAERVGIIEQFLLSCFRPVACYDELLVKKGVAMINECRGQISAAKLSENLRCTSRSLERKFSILLGKSPKQFIRIVRFQKIIERFSKAGNINFAQVAYENGYFDQAHFIKDFKDLSGYTPGEFVALGPCHADYFE